MARGAEREDIAVVGMAGRFPGARSIDELWSLLVEGREGIATLPNPEPPPGSPQPPPGPYVPRRGIVADIDRFDAGFFRMSGSEADLLDPQHRLMLEVAWEALEDACLADCDGEPLGVFVSTSMSLYLLQNLLQTPGVLDKHGPLQLLLYNDKDTLATRLSYFLNTHGPSVTVQTGCSSSLVALHLACRSLLEGECSAALVGGVSLALPQDVGYFYSEQMIHSRDGRCRAFDEDASGTVRGNGACAVILKTLSSALAAGDPIWALVKGSAVNNDGREKVGFTAPGPRGQAAAITAALERAGVPPETIELIEAHGTGTPLGDPVEAQALKAAFRDVPFPPGRQCAIGALKTNLGHLDAAAGLAGFIKVCLSLAREEIPPTLHFRKLNSRISFDGTPFFINAERARWPRRETPRRAGVSAFGIGGTNVHVILEEAPRSTPPAEEPGPFLFAVSAVTTVAFDALRERYRAHLTTLRPAQLASFAASTLLGRRAFEHRCAFLARDPDEAAEKLGTARPTAVKRRARKLAISSTAATCSPASFAERLTALGVDAVAAERGDLRLELAEREVRILDSGGVVATVTGDPGRAFDLELLGALWERGVRVDWRRVLPGARPVRIPTYPFARVRHWIEPAAPMPAPDERPRGAAPASLDELRETILAEWRGLIGKRDLRAEENVFDAGATSLMVGQFIANCQAVHGLALSAVDCYRDPTASGLAAVVAAGRTTTSRSVAASAEPRRDATDTALETFTEL
jgi:acyl transferase domain-containing protein